MVFILVALHRAPVLCIVWREPEWLDLSKNLADLTRLCKGVQRTSAPSNSEYQVGGRRICARRKCRPSSQERAFRPAKEHWIFGEEGVQ